MNTAFYDSFIKCWLFFFLSPFFKIIYIFLFSLCCYCFSFIPWWFNAYCVCYLFSLVSRKTFFSSSFSLLSQCTAITQFFNRNLNVKQRTHIRAVALAFSFSPCSLLFAIFMMYFFCQFLWLYAFSLTLDVVVL